MRIRDGFNGERSIVMPKMLVEMMREDPLMSSLHITDIGYYPHAENHYRERKEPISEYVFIYCVEGKGWFETGGVRHQVHADSYFILPAGRAHSYGADGDDPWTIYWIHFSGTHASVYAAETEELHSVKPSVDSRIRTRTNLFEEIYGVLDEERGIESLRYAMSLFHHYLGSLRYLRQYRHAQKMTDDKDIVDAAIHFMNENIEKSITLAELASFTGYSTSYLSVVFRKRTGYSPQNYFNMLKVRHACKWLDDTDVKINTVCHKVGIHDPYYFSRLFSKVMGVSPKNYRNREKLP